MKNWKKAAAMAVTASLCITALAGCGGSSKTEEKTDSTEKKSASDNTLHYQIGVAIDSLNPQLANDGTSFSVLAQCMEGLYTKDEDGNAILAAAESVDKSDDGLTYTFKLRDDAKWSDGSDVTADDFVYAWQTLADPNTGSEYQFFVQTACLLNADDIVAGNKPVTDLGVEAVDDKTLKVTLSSPCAVFESLMTFPSFLPVKRDFAQEAGDNFATSADTILCNGAFKITDYEPSAMTIKAEKNDDYYDAGDVKLDGVEWQVILDNQTAAMSYESGDLDVVTLTGDLIEQYQDDENFSTSQDGYMWYISPNTEVKELANENIRLALAKSFDKEAVTATLLKDGSTPADYIVAENLAVSPDGTEFRKQAGTYDNWTYDVDAAKEYWSKGLSELGIDSLELELVTEDSDSAQQVAQFLQNEWQTNLEGLTVSIKVEPKKARLEDMQNGNYQLGLTRWGPDYADPMTDLDCFITGSSTNYGRYSNTEYDDTIDSAKYGELALDTEARWNALVDCEKMLADDCVVFPIYQQSIARMISPNVSGIYFYSTGSNYSFKYAEKK